MNKFEIEKAPSGATFIRHNLEPNFVMQVVQNDNVIYDKFNDVYDLFEFRGNTFALIIVQSAIDLDEVDDFRHIRSIIRRAWRWYRSQVHIEKYVPKDRCGIMEDDNYLLKASAKEGWWVCADKNNKIVVKWRDKLFDETQEVSELEDLDASISEIARMMQDIGKWLTNNHSEKL